MRANRPLTIECHRQARPLETGRVCDKANQFATKHQLDVFELEQYPIDVVAGATGANDFETEYVAVKRDRSRHVEDLEERRETFNGDSHGTLCPFASGDPVAFPGALFG